MKPDESESEEAEMSQASSHRARLPGFVTETDVGLGDVIKRVTSMAGIRPCAPCAKRAAKLNSWLVFSGRR
jgi:hypothetical protein